MAAEMEELSCASQCWRREAGLLKSKQDRFNSNMTKRHRKKFNFYEKKKERTKDEEKEKTE